MRGTWMRKVLTTCGLLVAHLGGVLSQTTDVECLPYFGWMSNSQNQNPCVVASNLLANCAGSYNVEILPESTHYLGPLSVFNATSCQCNTVVYSLMSACGDCQGRTYIPWSQWSANCPTVSSGYPLSLPTGLRVPGWAYLDPRPSDTFDQLRAQRSANLTESVVLPPSPSTTSGRSRPTNTRNSTSSTSHLSTSTSLLSPFPTESTPFGSSNDSDVDASRPSRTKVIVGATVGAFAGALLLAGITWFIYQKGKKSKNGIQLVSPIEEKSPGKNDLEHGTPAPANVTQPTERLIPQIVVRGRSEERASEDMLRYIEATVPAIHSPSSSNTGTLPPASNGTASEPPSPTIPIHQHTARQPS